MSNELILSRMLKYFNQMFYRSNVSKSNLELFEIMNNLFEIMNYFLFILQII